MTPAIRTENLTKTYSSRWQGKRNAVDNLTLTVSEGEIFGLLGPNGAGKTTVIKMLLSIIYPTSGRAWIMGRDIGDIRLHFELSYLPEKPYYYEHMTGLEVLDYYGKLFRIPAKERERRAAELLERVGLAGDAHKPIGQYSKGMQQRIGLAQCLLNDPKILFLDEPTGGLDPLAHTQIRSLILALRDEGKTVFISSHELSEVERICDRVAMMFEGRVIKEGTLDTLLAGGRIEMIAENVPQEVHDSLHRDGVIVSLSEGRLIADFPDDGSVNEAVDLVRSKQGRVISIIPRRKRLEDWFVETVGAAQEVKV
ncbi:MAG: ABC transporter ATP-binding protein [Fimbriimonadales bacterium]